MANFTPNYQLHQWEPEDPFLRTDFNADLSKIDTALGALKSTVDLCGNCEVIYGSYTGTGKIGEATPNTLTFPNKPALVLIAGSGIFGFTSYNANSLISIQAGNNNHCYATWSANGKKLSWYTTGSFPEQQLNALNQVYRYCVWTTK